MDFFIDVALECQKLNNFNSFMAIAGEILLTKHITIYSTFVIITAGLYMSPVVRLRKTVSKYIFIIIIIIISFS